VLLLDFVRLIVMDAMLRVLAKAAEDRHRSRISLLRCSPEGMRGALLDGLIADIFMFGWSDLQSPSVSC